MDKYCNKCRELLPDTHFSTFRINGREYLRSTCKTCQAKYAAEYRKLHREYYINYCRQWRINKRQAS